MALSKEDALRYIASRLLIAVAGKFTVQVTSVNPFMRGDQLTQIVNFKAMTPFHVTEAKRLAKEGDYTKASNQNLSASLLPGMYIPQKGEIVDIEVANVTTKSGVSGLFVTGVVKREAVAAASLGSFSFDDEDETIDTTAAPENAAPIANEPELV